MKIALPIALVLLGVTLVAVLLTPHAWKERTYADHQADQNKIDQAKEKLFETNPAIKAEDSDLNQKYEQAEKALRDARQSDSQAHTALLIHDQKVRDLLVKADPSLNDAYDLIQFDERVSLDQGDQQLLAEYGGEHASAMGLTLLVIRVLPIITLIIGVILIVHPPTLAGAHLFLISIIVPLILLGPVMLQFAVSVYTMRFSELGGDYAPTPYLFHNAHHELVRDYLSYIPSLVLYLALVIRIRLKERNGSSSP